LFSGHVQFKGFIPSAYGGSLLLATVDSGGQFASLSNLTALIDDAGEVVYSRAVQVNGGEEKGLGVKSWFHGVVVDPLRDLVIETRPFADSEATLVVQEYGCLE
jgi:predicted lipid carrier protein YhbT